MHDRLFFTPVLYVWSFKWWWKWWGCLATKTASEVDYRYETTAAVSRAGPAVKPAKVSNDRRKPVHRIIQVWLQNVRLFWNAFTRCLRYQRKVGYNFSSTIYFEYVSTRREKNIGLFIHQVVGEVKCTQLFSTVCEIKITINRYV